MALQDGGKQVMLAAFGTNATKCRLYDATPTELTGSGYAEQTISWTYDGVGIILDADELLGESFVAEFNVPAGTVRYVGFLKSDGTLLARHDLAALAETFTNPGIYQVTAASLELDPA